METRRDRWKGLYLAIAAAIAWLGLGLQFYFMMRTSIGRGIPPATAIVRYLSYFTILTNLLVGLALTLPYLMPDTSAGRFFSRPTVQAGIVIDIALVCIGYNLLLRHVWNPQGLAGC
jgi:hypothetical protein